MRRSTLRWAVLAVLSLPLGFFAGRSVRGTQVVVVAVEQPSKVIARDAVSRPPPSRVPQGGRPVTRRLALEARNAPPEPEGAGVRPHIAENQDVAAIIGEPIPWASEEEQEAHRAEISAHAAQVAEAAGAEVMDVHCQAYPCIVTLRGLVDSSDTAGAWIEGHRVLVISHPDVSVLVDVPPDLTLMEPTALVRATEALAIQIDAP